jgi:hypothetical protein
MPNMPARLLTLPLSCPMQPDTARSLDDARILVLARAACARDAALRRPFLRGRWQAAHLDGVAVAATALGVAEGDIDPADTAKAKRRISKLLRQRLAAAPPVADGLNSLAEFLGGRASSHADRLVVVHGATAPKHFERTTASFAADSATQQYCDALRGRN